MKVYLNWAFLLFDFQMGMTTWYSMLKMTAQMMTEAKVVLGMKAQ
jgi:hypothetical protein